MPITGLYQHGSLEVLHAYLSIVDLSAVPVDHCSKEAKRTKTRELPLVSGGLPGFKIAKGQTTDTACTASAAHTPCILVNDSADG